MWDCWCIIKFLNYYFFKRIVFCLVWLFFIGELFVICEVVFMVGLKL